MKDLSESPPFALSVHLVFIEGDVLKLYVRHTSIKADSADIRVSSPLLSF